MRVIFSHGLKGSPDGFKITKLSEALTALGHEVVSVDYRELSIREWLIKLAEVAREGDVLVGSSAGGFVSAEIASRKGAAGLFLMAPALYKGNYPLDGCLPPINVPTEIVHGWHDDVIPFANSLRYANKAACSLHLVDDDHRLHESIDRITSWLVDFVTRLSTP